MFRFRNVRPSDSIRTAFHDFLTKNCADYDPFSEANALRYKKYVFPSLEKNKTKKREQKTAKVSTKSTAANVFTYVSLVAFVCLIVANIISLAQTAKILSVIVTDVSFMFIIIAWIINILCLASKSKLSKLLLVLLFSLTSIIFTYATYFPPIASLDSFILGKAVIAGEIVQALLWLLFDNVEFDIVTKIFFAIIFTAIIILGNL